MSKNAGVEVLTHNGPRIDIAALLTQLAARGINEVLVEAGPRLTGEVFRLGLWDEAIVYVAPKLLGRDARPFADLSVDRLSDAITGRIADVQAGRRRHSRPDFAHCVLTFRLSDNSRRHTMADVKTIEGGFGGTGRKFAIVAGRFNAYIVDSLVDGAIDTLVRHGVASKDITLIKVPGCFELPLAVKKVGESKGGYDAIIALGAVIRGATPHFDYVAGQCAAGLARMSLELSLPVAFGVLTTDSIEQAIERAGTKAGNKGCDAAMTALEMVNMLDKLG